MRAVYGLEPGAKGESLGDGTRVWHWREPTGYIFHRAWETVARRPLTGQAFRLLIGLLTYSDWGNQVTASLAHVGRQVGLSPSTLTRALKALDAARLVLVDRRSGARSPCITLSPYLLWKGRPWRLAHAREQFDAQWRLCHLPPEAETDPPPPTRTRVASPPRGVTSRMRAKPFPHLVVLDEVSSQ